jgi:hypothetical protein
LSSVTRLVASGVGVRPAGSSRAHHTAPALLTTPPLHTQSHALLQHGRVFFAFFPSSKIQQGSTQAVLLLLQKELVDCFADL